MQKPLKISQNIVYQNWRTIISKKFVIDHKEVDIEVNQSTNSVLICPFDVRGNLILNSQFRFGPERFLLEFPGGGVQDIDQLESTAKKELLEETGFAGDLEFFETIWDSGYHTGQTHIFIATNCQKVASLDLETEEILKTQTFPKNEFKNLIQNSDFVHAAILAKLLYLKKI